MALHHSSVIPFKPQINTFDFPKFLKDIPGIKYKIENQILSLEQTLDGSLDVIKEFFTLINFDFTIDSSTNVLRLEKMVTLPRVTKQSFFELLGQYYLFNTRDNLKAYSPIINLIISELSSHIRIISGSDNPLRLLIDNIQHGADFNDSLSLFTTLLEDQEWTNLLNNSSNALFLKSVSVNTWLHVLRHPTEAKSNLTKFLQFLSTITGKFPYIFTEIPLVDPKGSFVLSLTFLDSVWFSDLNDLTANDDLTQILNYWLTFGSLILRNISYSLIRFSNLPLEGFTHEDIVFYDYFKPKLTKFSESCFNPDLVEAFKLYDNARGRMIPSIRGHELYTYNRSSILEYHLKQAQQEYSKFPSKKILRKRVNRRQARLYSFLNDIVFIFKDYLNEISSLTKASGNYTSLDKIIKNDKLLN